MGRWGVLNSPCKRWGRLQETGGLLYKTSWDALPFSSTCRSVPTWITRLLLQHCYSWEAEACNQHCQLDCQKTNGGKKKNGYINDIKEQGEITGWKIIFLNYCLDFSTTALSSFNGFNLWSIVCFLPTSVSRLNECWCWKTGINQPV